MGYLWLLATLSWNWYVDGQTPNVIYDRHSTILYGVSAGSTGHTVQPYSGTTVSIGTKVWETENQGHNPQTPPTWPAPFTAICNTMNPYDYHGPWDNTNQSLYLEPYCQYWHEFIYEEFLGRYRRMKNDDPLHVITRTSDHRYIVDEQRRFTLPDDGGEGG